VTTISFCLFVRYKVQGRIIFCGFIDNVIMEGCTFLANRSVGSMTCAVLRALLSIAQTHAGGCVTPEGSSLLQDGMRWAMMAMMIWGWEIWFNAVGEKRDRRTTLRAQQRLPIHPPRVFTPTSKSGVRGDGIPIAMSCANWDYDEDCHACDAIVQGRRCLKNVRFVCVCRYSVGSLHTWRVVNNNTSMEQPSESPCPPLLPTTHTHTHYLIYCKCHPRPPKDPWSF